MPRWKMLVGKFYNRGTLYKAGDTFEATLDQVKGIRNQLQPLDAVEDYTAETDQDVPRTKIRAVHIGHGKWDVINTETDTKLNDFPLNKREAQQMVDKELSEEEAALKSKEDKPKIAPPPPPPPATKKVEPEKVDDTRKPAADATAPKQRSADKEATRNTTPVARERSVPARRRSKLA